MPYAVAKFGWIPDLPDHRDLLFSVSLEALQNLPKQVDLRAKCPPVYDQGQLGSCTANAIAGAIEFDQIKLQLPEFTPSRLFIYYNERVIEHTVNSDAGAQLRDGLKSVSKQGACHETLWPYSDGTSKFHQKPSDACYKDALLHKVVGFQRLTQTLSQLKGCLASGYPFVFGFTVYENFPMSEPNNGVVPLPQGGVLGGHAILAVGYDDATGMIIFRNSWNTGWGDKGYGYMPYAYVTDSNLASDFWTIRIVQ